jgi:hypothetical protein
MIENTKKTLLDAESRFNFIGSGKLYCLLACYLFCLQAYNLKYLRVLNWTTIHFYSHTANICINQFLLKRNEKQVLNLYDIKGTLFGLLMLRIGLSFVRNSLRTYSLAFVEISDAGICN